MERIAVLRARCKSLQKGLTDNPIEPGRRQNRWLESEADTTIIADADADIFHSREQWTRTFRRPISYAMADPSLLNSLMQMFCNQCFRIYWTLPPKEKRPSSSLEIVSQLSWLRSWWFLTRLFAIGSNTRHMLTIFGCASWMCLRSDLRYAWS